MKAAPYVYMCICVYVCVNGETRKLCVTICAFDFLSHWWNLGIFKRLLKYLIITGYILLRRCCIYSNALQVECLGVPCVKCSLTSEWDVMRRMLRCALMHCKWLHTATYSHTQVLENDDSVIFSWVSFLLLMFLYINVWMCKCMNVWMYKCMFL